MKQSELDQMKCSAQDEEEFRENILNPTPPRGADKAQPPPGTTLDQLHRYCLPSGERAYHVGGGIKPPKAISYVDPDYPEAARKAKKEGRVVLMLVVDTNGRPTTVSIVQSLGSGLDAEAVAAVSKWRFQPAKFGDQSVPVVINVEINFKVF